MKKKYIAAATLIPLVVAAALYARPKGGSEEEEGYRTGQVEQGSLKATVSATGSLSAVTTVQVGTQVSGQVSALYVDFNDRVKKGQLLARIDPTLPEQAVREAETSLMRARAELEQAQREYDRNAELHQSKVVTDAEFGTAKYQLQVAKASVQSAQISLERARRNLSYTNIYAPIDGIVVERNVDVGQTVAASLSAPQLFLIAQDLGEMQILAAVDESDIGQIHEGMPVEFSVQAYQDRQFTGTVKQVRLQSATTENVVSYTAVVSVKNDDGKLLPGMTATAEFITGEAKDALLVPNAALRFRPATTDSSARASASASASGARAGAGAGAGAAGGNFPGAMGGFPGGNRAAMGGQRTRPAGMGRIWVMENGKPTPIRVKVGLTDGQKTVVSGEGVKAGLQILIGANTGGGTQATTTANPFQNQGGQQGARRGPPGAF